MRTSSSSANEESFKPIPCSAVADTPKFQFRAACQLAFDELLWLLEMAGSRYR
jgi:hypothetical protein